MGNGVGGVVGWWGGGVMDSETVAMERWQQIASASRSERAPKHLHGKLTRNSLEACEGPNDRSLVSRSVVLSLMGERARTRAMGVGAEC